ncbi:hypothetical protein B0H14DRAFT_2560764 [Mycena olivaceomarginata]|nr:hypothetical protein B0H14DRAFT_2560764 [Mycena olivaceomarginata]
MSSSSPSSSSSSPIGCNPGTSGSSGASHKASLPESDAARVIEGGGPPPSKAGSDSRSKFESSAPGGDMGVLSSIWRSSGDVGETDWVTVDVGLGLVSQIIQVFRPGRVYHGVPHVRPFPSHAAYAEPQYIGSTFSHSDDFDPHSASMGRELWRDPGAFPAIDSVV